MFDLSLLDCEGCEPVRYLLMYSPHCETSAWWTRWLHKDFAHVEILRLVEPGLYIGVLPFHDYLMVEVVEGAPTGVLQNVTAKRKRGVAMWPFGLKTCVSVAKSMLGVRAAGVVTPMQLYKYIEKRNGIV